MYKKIIILSLIFNIFLGAFMFVFSEMDDSPGGQLLGLIAFIVGVSGLILSLRRPVN